MKRIPLVAKKALTYATRRLRAGDTFEASRQDARVLVAVGLARDGEKPVVQPVRQPLPPIVDMEIAELRYQYEAKTGRAADGRWGVARLKAEIEALS